MSSSLPESVEAVLAAPPASDEEVWGETAMPSERAVPLGAGRTEGFSLAPYLLALPHTLVLLVFLVLPIAAIVVVSFWDFNGFTLVPGFTLDNYDEIFRVASYRATYLNTLRFAAIVWTATFIVGFPVAYFLAFHVQSVTMRTALFLVCTVPFLTSNIIRSISWIPFLGRNGILNGLLIGTGITNRPLDIFLYSDVSVVLAMVHLYT